MEKTAALTALSGLAHETRLDIFRLLVEAGPEGMAAGEIGERLGLAPATLSFHLAHLRHAGLVDHERDGRSLIYAAEFARMAELVAYLTENCCAGRPEACSLPDCAPPDHAPADRAPTRSRVAGTLAKTRSGGAPRHEAPARARRR